MECRPKVVGGAVAWVLFAGEKSAARQEVELKMKAEKMSDRCQLDEPRSQTECQIIKRCVIGKAVKETGDVVPSEGRIERGPEA